MVVVVEEDKEVKRSRDLLWDCFVNWSFTLERIERRESDAPER
jgi:hypothetical protein